jgi:hypothetical protein
MDRIAWVRNEGIGVGDMAAYCYLKMISGASDGLRLPEMTNQ